MSTARPATFRHAVDSLKGGWRLWRQTVMGRRAF